MFHISIVTPSYNMRDWLRLCVAAIADQEGVSVEHLICDGNSKDDTIDWLRELTGAAADATAGEMTQARAGGFTYRLAWVAEPDKGMYDAINKGLRKATAPICGYINCDEQYLPGALKSVVAFMAASPGTDIAIGDVIVTDGEGQYLFQREMLCPSAAHIRVAGMQLLTCALFYRKSIAERDALYFDTRWRDLGDVMWGLTALEKKLRFGLLKQFTSIFAETGSNMNLGANALREKREFLASMPAHVWFFRHVIIAWYRVRRLLAGHYRTSRLSYALYTAKDPLKRTVVHVDKTVFRWKTRENTFWPSLWESRPSDNKPAN